MLRNHLWLAVLAASGASCTDQSNQPSDEEQVSMISGDLRARTALPTLSDRTLYHIADGVDLDNPDQFTVVLALHTRTEEGRHAQIYQCAAGATGAFAWVNRAPLVDDFDLLSPRGAVPQNLFSFHHFRNVNDAAFNDPTSLFGPYQDPNVPFDHVAWQIDPSFGDWVATVTGTLDAQQPNPGAIPLFRLTNAGSAVTPPRGIAQLVYNLTFGRTQYILRLNTSGGTAPTEPCDADHANAVVPSDYAADYYFVAPRGA